MFICDDYCFLIFLTPYTKAEAAKKSIPPSIGKPGGGGGGGG